MPWRDSRSSLAGEDRKETVTLESAGREQSSRLILPIRTVCIAINSYYQIIWAGAVLQKRAPSPDPGWPCTGPSPSTAAEFAPSSEALPSPSNSSPTPPSSPPHHSSPPSCSRWPASTATSETAALRSFSFGSEMHSQCSPISPLLRAPPSQKDGQKWNCPKGGK